MSANGINHHTHPIINSNKTDSNSNSHQPPQRATSRNYLNTPTWVPLYPQDGNAMAQTHQWSRRWSVADVLILIISFLFFILNASPSPQYTTTMGIKTRSATPKDKPISKTLVATAATPVDCHKDWRSKRLAKSPHPTSGNPLITELNQPGARFDNVP